MYEMSRSSAEEDILSYWLVLLELVWGAISVEIHIISKRTTVKYSVGYGIVTF
jgi:hypothetical protein